MAAKGEVDNIRVAVRCRPLTPKELKESRQSVVRVDQLRGQVHVQVLSAHGRREKERSFTFDTVFGPDTKQTDVFNETARPIVDFVLEGYNGTIFAYGQTGTGKTYTMEGEKEEPQTRGIVPNSFAHIFGHIAKCGDEARFLVRVSYLELYNEEVRDLLGKDTTARLKVRERTDIGVYVKDLSSFVVKNADEMDKLMAIGDESRQFAATGMNDRSSRSHVIFTITVERSDLGPDKQQHVRMGKLHLVDLAGSERLSMTGNTGERKKEGILINLSLSTLGNVISALVDGTFVPYRNSQLTRLLQDSLGGNSKTVMIANIGPADYCWKQTIDTLKYANRAKNIQNCARINEDPKDALLRAFQQEIDELKKQLEEESGGESGEEEEGGEGKNHSRHRKGRRKERGGSALSPRSLAAMEAQILKEKEELLAKKGMEEGEKARAESELKRKEDELRKAQEQQAELEQKLQDLRSKVIVGGVNLLEQAEEQERLLEASAAELEKRKRREAQLRRQLREKEAEKLDMEERYASLQEEAIGKTRKLKEVWKQFQAAKEEVADLRAEFQQENEEMLDTLRQLSREAALQQLIIDSFIPEMYQKRLEQEATWHEETGEWHIHGIAYAGNNMRKEPSLEPVAMPSQWDTATAYLTYQVGSAEVKSLSTSQSGTRVRPKAARKTTSPSKSKSRRAKRPSDVEDRGSVRAGEEEDLYPASRGLISQQKHFA